MTDTTLQDELRAAATAGDTHPHYADLMAQAADRLDAQQQQIVALREGRPARTAVPTEAELLDRALEVLSGAMFTFVDRQQRADSLVGDLLRWRGD